METFKYNEYLTSGHKVDDCIRLDAMNENLTYIRGFKKTEITEIKIKRFYHQTQTIGSKNTYLMLSKQIGLLMI